MTGTLPLAAQLCCDDAKRNIGRGGAMDLANALICLDAARTRVKDLIAARRQPAPVFVPEAALDEVGALMAERDALLCSC